MKYVNLILKLLLNRYYIDIVVDMKICQEGFKLKRDQLYFISFLASCHYVIFFTNKVDDNTVRKRMIM